MLVIPAIDLVQGKCVRLYQGDWGKQTTYAGDPVDQARNFQAAGFARLHVVDLEGARWGSGHNRQAIRDIVRAVKVPVQVGGGIRSSRDVAQLNGWDVRYLILGTVVLKEPDRVSEWVKERSADAFMVSLDLKGGKLQSQGWMQESDLAIDQVIERIASWGVKQVICTDVERDGTLDQPNYSTYCDLLERLPGGTSLIAAGGVSRPDHITRLREMGVEGVVVGRALYEGEVPWEEFTHAG